MVCHEMQSPEPTMLYLKLESINPRALYGMSSRRSNLNYFVLSIIPLFFTAHELNELQETPFKHNLITYLEKSMKQVSIDISFTRVVSFTMK